MYTNQKMQLLAFHLPRLSCLFQAHSSIYLTGQCVILGTYLAGVVTWLLSGVGAWYIIPQMCPGVYPRVVAQALRTYRPEFKLQGLFFFTVSSKALG